MPRSKDRSPIENKDALFERVVTDAFRSAGWKVKRQRSDGVDLVLSHGNQIYIAELKVIAEARRDRAVPLLAQAILQVQTRARSSKQPVAPLAIIASERVPESVALELQNFAAHYAPEVAVGAVDSQGFRSFRGPGLEAINAPRSSKAERISSRRVSSPHLFSDLNQWMQKVLLAPAIAEPYLCAPRRRFKNASQLAEAAGVTVMSAFRLVRGLKEEGFLDEASGVLKLVRIPDLLQAWQAANLRPAQEIPVRWVIAGGSKQLGNALRAYGGRAQTETTSSHSGNFALRPRVCLALFAAADALGTGFVQGVPPTIYLEKADVGAMKKLGLSLELSGEPPDVFVRIPRSPEAVFRALVIRDGVPVSDVLQVWLDVSNHPARGKEQAEQLKRGVLAPLFAGDF
ncbi:MAG TPA: hypothetical protein VF865_12485 [Acidobacteriaceae bacterium]